MHGHHWNGEGWHEGWGWTGPVMMLLFWLLLAVSLFAVLRSTGLIGRGRKHEAVGTGTAGTTTSVSDAEKILHERFARGEIDEAEYTSRHEVLQQRGGA